MFGTIIYGTTPYATKEADDDDDVFNPWVEQCRNPEDWEKEINIPTDIRRCSDAT